MNAQLRPIDQDVHASRRAAAAEREAIVPATLAPLATGHRRQALLEDLARLRAALHEMQSQLAERVAALRAENERLAAEKAGYEARLLEYKRILKGG